MLQINANNFRSYNKLQWSLPDGLTLIDGDNQDTGGSNMSGKSTLCDIWFWGRYGWLPKWAGPKGGPADAVIQRGTTGCTVRIIETFGQDEIIIERSRPNRLLVWKNGEEQKSINQKELNQLLGMGPERFLLCVYISQKRKNSFYHMGDRERTDLLSIVSGLEQLDDGLADGKKKKDAAKENINYYEGQKIAYGVQLREMPARVTTAAQKKADAAISLKVIEKSYEISKQERDKQIPIVQKEIAERVIKEIKPFADKRAVIFENIETLFLEISGLKYNLNDTPKPEVFLYAAIQATQKDMLEAERLILDVAEIERENRHYDLLYTQALQRAIKAKEGVCDSCSQALPENVRKRDHKRHMQNAERNKALIEPIPDKPKLGPIRSRYDQAVEKLRDREYELRQQPDKIRSKIELLQAQLDAKKQEESSIEQAIQSIKNEVRRECNEKIRLLDEAVDKLATEKAYVQNSYNQAKEICETVLLEQKNIKDHAIGVEKSLATEQSKLDLALDLIDLFGPKGFRAVCFDGLVNRISDRAGQLLQIMTDGLYSTYMEQMGQDSKGNQKLILKPVILKGSVEVPKDDLSGGAEDRVALAYDVAVSEAAGDNMPLLLDEVFTALDATGKSEAMTLLEEVSKSRPVLVIDHSSEFKAMFNQVQTIVYKDGYSRLNDILYNVDHESTG